MMASSTDPTTNQHLPPSSSNPSFKTTLRRRHKAHNVLNLLVTGHPHAGKKTFVRTLASTLNITKILNGLENSFNGGMSMNSNNSSMNDLSDPSVPKSSVATVFTLDGSGSATNTTNGSLLRSLSGANNETRDEVLFAIPPTGSNLLYETFPLEIHPGESRTGKLTVRLAGVTDKLQALQYIESKFWETFKEESKINRNPRSKPDGLVHVVLYFVDPLATMVMHNRMGGATEPLGPKEEDLKQMEEISKRSNLILVLAKSDLLSIKETEKFKECWLEMLRARGIRVFDFDVAELSSSEEDNDDDEDGDEEGDEMVQQKVQEETAEKDEKDNGETNNSTTTLFPTTTTDEPTTETYPKVFRIFSPEDPTSSTKFTREYAHGSIDLTNPVHSDFEILKILLIEYFDEMKSNTRYKFYETWRTVMLTRGLPDGENSDEEKVPAKQMLKTAAPQPASVLKHSNTSLPSLHNLTLQPTTETVRRVIM